MKKITMAFLMLFSASGFAQDGTPDTSFGTNGYVLVNTDDGASFARFIEPDGKIIYIQGTQFKRLNANGTPDLTFGVNGAINIVQPFEYIESFTVNNNHITLITKAIYDTYTLGRYNFDGTVDASLGSGAGYTGINLGTHIKGHVKHREMANNQLLIAGNSDTAYGSYNDYYVRRYNADGTLDSTFNFDASELGINITYTPIGYPTMETMWNLYLRPSGSVIVSGISSYRDTTNSGHQQGTFAIISGSAQPVVKSHNYDCYYAEKSDMAFDADGNMYMLAGGIAYSAGNLSNVIQKWTAAGNTASSFGTSGVLTLADLNISATSKADFSKILVQPDGKILLAGTVYSSSTFGHPYLIMARYLTDGTLDTTFNTTGYVLFDIPHPNTSADKNSITQFFATEDYSSIYMCGNNWQNAVVLKYSNDSMLPPVVPSFDLIAPICAGDAAPQLQATSNNGITGTWSPSTIDNTASGVYTFTPDAGQNATVATLSVIVNQPTFSSATETACESYQWDANGTTYTESGIYTFLSENEAGCTHTATLNLTVNHNTSSTEDATACGSYVWAANNQEYTDGGVYTYVTTNASGCENVATLNLVINNAVEIDGASEQTFVEGATLADIVLTPGEVIWYASESDAAGALNPIGSDTLLVDGTTYYAVYTTPQGCPGAPFPVTVAVTLANGDFEFAGFSLYPNPVTDVISVRNATVIDQVSVSNMLGQMLMTRTVGTTEGTINVSALPAGTYLVKVLVNGAAKTYKVIKS